MFTTRFDLQILDLYVKIARLNILLVRIENLIVILLNRGNYHASVLSSGNPKTQFLNSIKIKMPINKDFDCLEFQRESGAQWAHSLCHFNERIIGLLNFRIVYA